MNWAGVGTEGGARDGKGATCDEVEEEDDEEGGRGWLWLACERIYEQRLGQNESSSFHYVSE